MFAVNYKCAPAGVNDGRALPVERENEILLRAPNNMNETAKNAEVAKKIH